MTINKMNKYVAGFIAIVILVGVSGCSDMSARDKSTAFGAGVGAAAAVVTGGSTLGILGGAAVGGVIGNQIGKDK